MRELDSPFLDLETLPAGSPARRGTAPTRGLDSPFLDAFSPEDPGVEAAETFDPSRRREEDSEGEGVEADVDRQREDELVLEYEAYGAPMSGNDNESAADDESPAPAPRAGAVAARILWPALGFPAVITPRSNGAAQAADADPRRSVCLLILSNKSALSSEDVARHLRIVPWADRSRRHIPQGEEGSFSASEVHVGNGGKPVLVRPEKDGRADAVAFGADRDGNNGIVVSLARRVREFYRQQGLANLFEIRISERASARLTGDQYHLFWNNAAAERNAPSDEMRLLVDRFARPRRKTLAAEWQKDFASLIDEYTFEYGALHPPYQQNEKQKRFTEVLHPVFVRRFEANLRVGHLTDTHVDVRADVYEENLKTAPGDMTWDGQRLLYKGSPVSYNNFNKAFVETYRDVKQDADIILLTGDLIDYGRGHVGLTANGRYRHRLGEDGAYHEDRNWFLFYYLLASGTNYTRPTYTILGNHDWRLNPYPPFAPGAPGTSSLFHNDADFKDKKGQIKDILKIAHGPGHERAFAYTLSAESKLGLLFKSPVAAGRGLSGQMDVKGSPVQTTVESVIWYLLLINPFLDYAFALPGGQQILMLDWAEDEEVMNTDEPRTFMGFGQRAANSLSSLQRWHVEEFASLPGKAKIIGMHAPPLGPYPEWSDQDLSDGKKKYAAGADSRARKPDGSIIKLTEHTLFAIRPKDAPFGVAADHGSFIKERDWFIRRVGNPAAGIRLVMTGHIHRHGLLVAYMPTTDKNALLIRGVTNRDIQGVRPPVVAVRRDPTRAFPAPLYLNTTSAGPRGNRYQPNHAAVPPGFAIVTLSPDGIVQNVSQRQLAIPSVSARPAHEVAEMVQAVPSYAYAGSASWPGGYGSNETLSGTMEIAREFESVADDVFEAVEEQVESFESSESFGGGVEDSYEFGDGGADGGGDGEEERETLFEGYAPQVSQPDLISRIDAYYDLANAEYDLGGGIRARARSQFRYATAGGIDEGRRKLLQVLGSGFEKKNPRAIHNALYGRPKLAQITALTQGLIDAGELDKVRADNPGLTNAELIRRMQRLFRVGIDCAGYVQLAFIHAYMGSDNDSAAVRRQLGLQEERGNERLSDLPLTHFTKLKVTDAEAGDLLILSPRPGDKDRAWHTILIVEHTISGDEHRFIGDASWGNDLYGEKAGGIARRTLVHDAKSGEWWDVHPISGADAHRNTRGPYNGHPINGLYRPKHAAVKKAATTKPPAKATREVSVYETSTPAEERVMIE